MYNTWYNVFGKREEEEMNKDRWRCSSKIKEFTGRLGIDDTSDEKNYVCYAEFYKKLC